MPTPTSAMRAGNVLWRRVGDLVDLADVAVGEPAPQLLERRVEPLDVPDGADQAARGERLSHPAARLGRVRDGLLDEGVDAGIGEGHGGVEVVARGHGDDGEVDAGGDQRVDIRQHVQARRDPVRITAGIGDGDEVDSVDFAEHSGVMATHHPDAEQACPQRHQAPAPATAFTARTMRSRSAWASEGCTGSETTSRAATSVTGRSRPGAYGASEGRR